MCVVLRIFMASILGGHPFGADASVVKNFSRKFFPPPAPLWKGTRKA